MNQNTKPKGAPAVATGAWSRVLKHQGEPVLSIFLAWPTLQWDTAGGINRYYRTVSEQWRTRWEGPLFRRACAALEEARNASRPFRPWEATLRFTVTLLDDQLFSLYTEACECTTGTHRLTVRQGDCWGLAQGTPRPLSSFFPPKAHWKKLLLTAANQQIAQRHAAGEARFDDDYPAKLAHAFRPERYYVTGERLFFFYPLCSISPYVEGIPTFSIPRPCPKEQSHISPK